MAINVNLIDVMSGLLTASAITENNTRIESGFEQALSREPASNNAMETFLDMGGYPITNIAYDANDETSAVTKAVFENMVAPLMQELANGIDAAEAARDAAQQAQANAETAEFGAEIAKQDALIAQSNAELAQSLAEVAESNAEGFAVDASGYADAAQAEVDRAEILFENYKSNYYGAYHSQPSEDPNGFPSTEGDMYYDLTENVLKIYREYTTAPIEVSNDLTEQEGPNGWNVNDLNSANPDFLSATQDQEAPDGSANEAWTITTNDNNNLFSANYGANVGPDTGAPFYSATFYLKKTTGATVFPIVTFGFTEELPHTGAGGITSTYYAVDTNTGQAAVVTDPSVGSDTNSIIEITDAVDYWLVNILYQQLTTYENIIYGVAPAAATALDGSVDFTATGSVGFYPNTVGKRDQEWINAPDAPVFDVFGRVGSITAEAGDYSATQVDYDNTASGLSSTEVQSAVDEIVTSVESLTANQIDYDNTASGLSATELQAAVDELATSGGPVSADQVSYDNTTSGATPTNAQDAIDDLYSQIGDIATTLDEINGEVI